MTERSARHGPRATPREVADAVASALFLGYSAPMPGGDSRYSDIMTAHEARLLGVPALAASLSGAALLGERLGRTRGGLSNEDARLFARALEAAGPKSFGQRLGRALDYALSAGREATLRDAMRFAAAGRSGEPMAREYARSFEITRELARPALFNALVRVEATRPALVQAYLEVLSEVVDLDVAERAGRKEAEEVSRMANGVLKSGGV